MKSNPLFVRIVEDYKSHLRTCVGQALSFKSFCRGYDVRYKSVCQWMSRHGLDVGSLHCEVKLEGYALDARGVYSTGAVSRKATTEVELNKKSPPGGELRGISVNFPDGLIITIRHASAPALVKFIESYNKTIDRNHVRPE